MRDHPFIEFADDNTFVDKAWGKELCRQLAPLGVKWFTETDISVADDPELLESDARVRLPAGADRPGEPGGRSRCEGVECRSNFKARTAAGYLDAVRRIQAHGITVNGCFILGLDGHTPAIFEEVLEFARAVPLYDVQITVLTAFPGTPLYARLVREGRVLEPGRWDLCTLFDVNYEPRGMTRAAVAGRDVLADRAALQRRVHGVPPPGLFHGAAARPARLEASIGRRGPARRHGRRGRPMPLIECARGGTGSSSPRRSAR